MLVDRRRPNRAAIFGRASKLMQQGLSLIVFPEGTRSRDGRVAAFKGGSFYLALEAELPVVPISIVGSRHVMLKGRLATYPGRVKLIVHEPVDTTGLAGADPRAAKAFAARVRDIIAPDAQSDVAQFDVACISSTLRRETAWRRTWSPASAEMPGRASAYVGAGFSRPAFFP